LGLDESSLESPQVRAKFLRIKEGIRKEASKDSTKLNRYIIMNAFLELLDLFEMIKITRLRPEIQRKRVLYTYKVNPSFVDEMRSSLILVRNYGARPARAFLNFFYALLGYGFTPIEASYGVRVLYTVLKAIHDSASRSNEETILSVTRPIIEDFEKDFLTQGEFYSIGILRWITGELL